MHRSLALFVASAAPILAFGLMASAALAQEPTPGGIPQPPSTIAGSISDAAGPVPAGLKVEALIGNKVCGESETVYTGDGAARVTVYVVDVVSESQIADCGRDGVPVRIRIGEKLSERPVPWDQGLVVFNITFGDATPAPIPTFTPTAVPTATNTPVPGSTQPPTEASPGSETPGATSSPGGTGGSNTASPTNTTSGTASSATPGIPGTGNGGGGGVPVWAIVLLALGGIAAVGGGVGYFMSRSNAAAAGEGEAAPGE